MYGGNPAEWRGLKIAFAALGHHGLARSRSCNVTKADDFSFRPVQQHETKWVSDSNQQLL